MQKLAEAFRTAIEMERCGRKAYLEAADCIKEPVIKSIVLELANDEDEHERMINRYYHALQKNQGWPTPDGEDQITDLPERIKEMLRNAVTEICEKSLYADIYRLACGLERESRDFYLTQAEAADDRRLMEFFKFLARVEEAHLFALELLRDRDDRSLQRDDAFDPRDCVEHTA